MSFFGRNSCGVGVLFALISLSLPCFSGEAEFRVFRTHVSLAGEGDEPGRGTDYYLDGGGEDGLRVGQRLKVYRDQVVSDPVTGKEHAVRLPVGEVVLVSVAATAAVARPLALVSREHAPLLLHHAVMIGDIALPVVEGVSEAPTESSAEFGSSLPIEDALREYPNGHVIVEGHTCDLGPRAHNEKLALARARSVARNLTDRFGVPDERMTVVGYGPDRPADPSKEGAARNRRVELLFTTHAARN